MTRTAGVAVLPDPMPAGTPAGVWWPPAVLDPAWILANRDCADLLHVHFGTESFAPGHLSACIEAAHRASWPVVFTVHDLENPQLGDQAAYRDQLDELVVGADALITLTPGAAARIFDRWGRTAAVIPHPSILDPDAPIPREAPSDVLRIGVHLKDLRPNVDAVGSVVAMLDAAERLRARGLPAAIEVRMHHRVRDTEARDEVRRLCASDVDAIVIEHDRLGDAELITALARLDVCVLPYRFGTHSGWLELCWDLAVPVAAPTVGFYAQQHTDASVASFAPAVGASLAAAIDALVEATGSTRSHTRARAKVILDRRAIRSTGDEASAAAQVEIYRRLVGRRS